MSTTEYVDVETALQNLEQSSLHPVNVTAIQTFIDHLAAEGVSEVRQRRVITALKSVLRTCAPPEFRLADASEAELKQLIANLNRSSYAASTKHTMRSAIKKYYKVENGGHEHPEKVAFFSVDRPNGSTVTRQDLFTQDELQRLFGSFTNTRDRALTMTLYESAARPGELLSRTIGDFSSNEKGDFIFLEGLKETPDRTNQLVRAGRPLREWLAQHPYGGQVGDVQKQSAPLWVKTEQQQCRHCGARPHEHGDACAYEPDQAERLRYDAFLRRFKAACDAAEIPANKRRPYNLRHTRLTAVATFMGYEQLNKFAGWVPGSSRAKVYVHLTNDDVNQAIREQYGLGTAADDTDPTECPFCGAENQPGNSECRTCGRPLGLEETTQHQEKLRILERLAELEDKGVLEKLEQLETETDDETRRPPE